MKKLIPVLLLFTATICSAEGWIYTGSTTEFVPASSQLGEGWSRSLIRTVNEENEMKGFFQSTHPVDSGLTTNYEAFRRENRIRELSETEYYFVDTALGKQTYQLIILLFENHEGLDRYWKATHPKHLKSPVLTTTTEGTQRCVFRLQNIYVRVSSKLINTECERIAGMVFNSIQTKENESNKSE